jgi:hypothetical protein
MALRGRGSRQASAWADRGAHFAVRGAIGSFTKAAVRFAKLWRIGAHRSRLLLALAAISTFILALPNTASACVNSCPGGTVGVNGGGFPFCQGGANNGQLVCTSGSGGGGGNSSTPGRIPFPLIPFGTNFGGFDANNMPLRITGEWLQGLAGGGPTPLPVAPGMMLGGPVNATPIKFSIYSPELSAGPYATGDVLTVHNSGYRASDSNGAIAPGSVAPGFNSTQGGGGANLQADGGSLLGFSSNQSLLFGLNFDYQHANTTYGTSALTPGVGSAGTESDDIYTLKGSVSYAVNSFYVSGLASYDWNNVSVTQNTGAATAQGNTRGQGYTVGATVGYLFSLLNTTGVGFSPMPTKAGPVARYGGYALFLDLNGHAGYQKQWESGFTDSTGFAVGTEQLSFTDLGTRATLIGVVPSAATFSWMPYLGFSVDQQIGFNHSIAVPLQAASAADTIFLAQSTTFWGVQGGLNIFSRAGLTAGLTGYYQASGDTQIAGGGGFVRIPFIYGGYAAAGSGIREATR